MVTDPLIKLVEGEIVTYTLTLKRDGVAENLTGLTILCYAHDNGQKTRGTNVVNGLACTIVSALTGVISVTFNTTHTLVPNADTDVEGTVGFLLTMSGRSEWTAFYDFVITRNPFLNI